MKPIIPRGVFTGTRDNLDAFPLVKIQGARQVGKSTLAKMITEERSSVYKSLDNERLRQLAEEDSDSFVEAPDGSTVIIDEIQRVPKVSIAVKYSIDENRVPGRFVITGSSDFMRAAGEKDSLAGRGVGVRVFPLSLLERTLNLGVGTFIDRVIEHGIGEDLIPQHQCSKQEFAELIAEGGYPPVQGLSVRLRRNWFSSYIDDVVGLEAIDQQLTPYPGRLQAVLRMIAAQQSQELVRATLARETQIPETSISSYLDILQRVYLLELLPAWSRNLVERQKAKPKVFINDSGLAAHLANQSPKRWLNPEDPDPYFGRAIESAVFQELRAQQGWAENPYELFHWRDRTGREVDLIVELDDGSVVAIEVKSSGPRAKHFDQLKFIKGKLGKKFRAGFVVCSTDQVDRWGEGMYSIPWSMLWS